MMPRAGRGAESSYGVIVCIARASARESRFDRELGSSSAAEAAVEQRRRAGRPPAVVR
jgi:hypothetical protein